MAKSKAQKLKERKEKNRTFKENSAMAVMQDEITELKQRLDDGGLPKTQRKAFTTPIAPSNLSIRVFILEKF